MATSSALTKAALITRARDLVAEWDTSHFIDATVTRWLNEGHAEFAEQTKCLDTTESVTAVASTQEYTLATAQLPGTVYWVRFYDGTSAYKQLTPLVWPEGVYAYAQDWDSAEGEPINYYLRGERIIGLVPIPSSTYAGRTLKVSYKQEATVIDDSTNPNIPTEYQPLLPYYAAYRIALIDERPDLASEYLRHWRSGVARAVAVYAWMYNETPMRQFNSIVIAD